MLPALLRSELDSIATAIVSSNARALRHPRRRLDALCGRLLYGPWTHGPRNSNLETCVCFRDRPFDESSVRRFARALHERGATDVAAQRLASQVHQALRGAADVHGYTDMFDQVFWSKTPMHAGPIGARNKKLLAGTWFGMTFVRSGDGPTLGYALSWHKPATPLLDAVQALHDDPVRHRWLCNHIDVHILDRGTQGTAVLDQLVQLGVPYLTPERCSTSWARFRSPSTLRTQQGVAIHVRRDDRVRSTAARRRQSRLGTARRIVFPARPERGEHDRRAIAYRTSARLSDTQIQHLDRVYKARWPNNENAIKALLAVGFGRNLERSKRASPSRGQDTKAQRWRERVARSDQAIGSLMNQRACDVGRAYLKLERVRERRVRSLRRQERTNAAEQRQVRVAEKGELLCKHLMLLLHNQVQLVLVKSERRSVRAMTLARVRDLMLMRPATASRLGDTLTLTFDPCSSGADRIDQAELVRLFAAEQLTVAGARISMRIRDLSADLQPMRIAA